MTVTYPHDRPMPQGERLDAPREEPFVPVYARTGRNARGGRKGGVKTWMILAPIGVLVLGGAAAALVMGQVDEPAPAPLVEPAATAPVLPTQPLAIEAPVEAAAAPVVEATPAPAPVARRAAPARRTAPAPARPATPVATREAPAEPAGPQPYTSSLNTTPAAAPTPASPPVIVIQPQS